MAYASFPRLYAAASLKPAIRCAGAYVLRSFPRLYAAASLKPISGASGTTGYAFSAALCRGLIEAGSWPGSAPPPAPRFPRLYAAASLKLANEENVLTLDKPVFRGFMPRPH